MKAQCERCKEIVPLDFAVEGGAIRVSCPSCQAVYRVAPTREAAAPSTPAELTCPKCGEGQKQAEACRRCGLVFARWDPDAEGDLTIGDVKEAAALWAACEAGWDDPACHDAFIEHCRRAGVLGFAAGRYRRHASRPGAEERLKQIRTLAEQALVVMPRAAAPVQQRSSLPVRIGLVVVIVLLAYVMLRTLAP